MMKTHSNSLPLVSFNFVSFVGDFLQLTKFRLAMSVVFSSVAGYLLAVDQIDVSILLGLFFGGFAMVGASNAFNQWIEKDKDALMDRTKTRPLPTGRMSNSASCGHVCMLSKDSSIGITPNAHLIPFRSEQL